MLERIEKYLEATTLIPALAGHEEKLAAYLRREFEACGLPLGSPDENDNALVDALLRT